MIENERQPFFFTEKLIDCFSVGTIPIYWGASVIPLVEWRGVLRVAPYMFDPDGIRHYDEDAYRNIKPFAERNLKICGEYACCEEWIFDHYPELFNDE